MAAEIVPGLYRLPGVTGVGVYLWNPGSTATCAEHAGAPMLFDCGLPMVWARTGG